MRNEKKNLKKSDEKKVTDDGTKKKPMTKKIIERMVLFSIISKTVINVEQTAFKKRLVL